MIKLVCLHCRRTIAYARTIDPNIPANVARIEQPHCDECWDGEREGETWYNGAGNEVSQDNQALSGRQNHETAMTDKTLTKQKTDYMAGLLNDYAAGLEGDWVLIEDDFPAMAEDLRNAAKMILALSAKAS